MAGKHTAIVLSAGKGTRMQSQTAKQYLLIKEKPVIYYSLKAFEDCPFMEDVILVTAEEDKEYCRREIVEKYGFNKVKQIVAGGRERYESVWKGLTAAQGCSFVYIHDGARPFLTREILERLRVDAEEYQACAAGMPVKDTIKISNEDGYIAATPKRALVWQMQTPQVFAFDLVFGAYEKLLADLSEKTDLQITDDAMVVEYATDCKVKLTQGAYTNMKITTPEDLILAEALLTQVYS